MFQLYQDKLADKGHFACSYCDFLHPDFDQYVQHVKHHYSVTHYIGFPVQFVKKSSRIAGLGNVI